MSTRSAERTVAGRYRLLDRLGSGGMGTVWRAEDSVLGRDVAVKEVTFPNGVSDEEREVLRERTRREARAAARLDHPSAVTVYDVAEEDGTPYLVMELVDARTLAEVVRSDGPLSPQDTARMGVAVLGALQAAHAEGIVHRDVKPGNVLLRPDGRVVLTDFGIATFTGDSSITSTGLLLGSPSYIAPERARGEQPGPPSDLWSLGATMFTAVEGRAPYDKGEPLPTMTAVVTGDHAPFVAAGPLVPVLEGLLEKDPTKRMSAAQAQSALQAIADMEQTVTAPEPAPAGEAKRAERTTALSLGEVAQEVRHEEQPTPAPAAPTAYVPPARSTSPAAPRRSRTPLLLSALALMLVGGLGLLLTSVLRGGTPGGTGTAADPRPSAGSTTSGRSGSDTGSDSGNSGSGSDGDSTDRGNALAAAPAGWTPSSHDGWTVAVPASYTESRYKTSRQYRDAGTGRTLRIETGTGKPDAVADRREQAAFFAKTHEGYREIRIDKADYRGYEAADWEFTYSSGGALLHVINRVFVVDGVGHSLFFQTRGSDDWSAARGEFDRIAKAFQPKGA
ncbi:MAG: serine/threonine protein kinase [Frankiales bacterium]|nr:serine/threonine protein kinase [Frankiales bacterium]